MISENEFAKSLQYGAHFSIVMLDIDGFKHINDCYGHLAGDAVLKSLARICQENSHNKSDYFARFGGDEFVFVISSESSDKKHVTSFAKR